MTGNKAQKTSIVASHSKWFIQRRREHLVSLIHCAFGSSPVGRITCFLLKVAALEILRRFSKSRCSYVWHGLQALQILCYPPFKWIQRWAPFNGLVKTMQVLSTPLLALSIATVLSDQSQCSDGMSDCNTDSHDSVACPEPSSVQVDLSTSRCLKDSEMLESGNWLAQLNQVLENEGISLPERINDEELHRFYAASNNDFSCFLTSIKKTIRWRQTYRILSEEELKMWSELVFWHGFDRRHRPCLVVRLGLACSTLTSQDRAQYTQAVVSEVEYGVLHLVDADSQQITVLVDCEGLSPSRIPMQMMRYCSSLLQDHFPNRLGCLFVIRLPAVVHVIAQNFIQDLKPATRNKLKIEGEMYQKVLSDHLLTLPSYLGGGCTCTKCSEIDTRDVLQAAPYVTETSRRDEEGDISDNEDSPSLHDSHPSNELEGGLYGNYYQLMRTALISILMFWVFVAFGAVIFDSGSDRLLS